MYNMRYILFVGIFQGNRGIENIDVLIYSCIKISKYVIDVQKVLMFSLLYIGFFF